MLGTLGENAPSYSVVKLWIAEFKRGRKGIADEPQSRRPNDASTAENIHAVQELLNNDRRLTITHIAETTCISSSTAHRIINEHSCIKKISARWVPRMLTAEQIKCRVDICEDLLGHLQAEPKTFLNRIVTQDETWVHHFDPKSKRESIVWKHVGSPPPKKLSRSQHQLARSWRRCFGIIKEFY